MPSTDGGMTALDGGAIAVSLADFRPGDADELVPMWRESFEAGVGVKDPHPIEEQRDYLFAKVAPHYTIKLAIGEGRILGFAAANRESIAQLYVRVGCQRRGIGARLLAWAKAQSDGSLWLYTFARNSGARAFYERHGFRIAARGFEPHWQLDDLRYEWP